MNPAIMLTIFTAFFILIGGFYRDVIRSHKH
jgi:hypothetical protein